MRIFFYATYPDQSIGYSIIGNKISNYLASKDDVEVYYFGISNFVHPSEKINRYINPKIKFIDAFREEQAIGSKELYGVNVISDHIKRVNPDIVILYNDTIVVSRIFNEFVKNFNKGEKPFKVYTYIDLVYNFQKHDYIRHINNHSDKILVFSEHWKKNIVDMLGSEIEEKVEVLPHGVNMIKSDVNIEDCKSEFKFDNDDFIVLNTNKNSYRKGMDLTIEGFLKFLKKNNLNPKIKLFLNMSVQSNSGHDLLELIRNSCKILDLDYELIVSKHIFNTGGNNISDKGMDTLYRCCDVGINTTFGEGFGLCNVEHAFRMKPQVVTKTTAYNDIFSSIPEAYVDVVTRWNIPSHLDGHLGILDICSSTDVGNKLDDIYKNYDSYKEIYEREVPGIMKRYSWDNVYKIIDKTILS